MFYSWQIWTSPCHNCNQTDGCICIKQNEGTEFNETVLVNPACLKTGHSGSVFSVVFSPDSTRVLSCSYDSLAKIWDVEAGTEVSSHGGGAL